MKKWWPDIKTFWTQDFVLEKVFDPPLYWNYKKGIQNFVEDVEIEKSFFIKMSLHTLNIEIIQKLSNRELLRLHDKMHYLYENVRCTCIFNMLVFLDSY